MADYNTADLDLTSDLDAGPGDAALADVNPVLVSPPGAQPKHGDAKAVNEVERQQTTTPSDKAPAKELTLRDQLSNAFKGQQDKPEVVAEPAKEASPPPALVKDADGKYRLPDGTFAGAQQITAFEAAQAPAQVEQSPAVAGMTPLERQQFQSLPAEIQQYVGRTMEDLNSRASRYNEYDAIEQNILGPRRQAFAQQGMNPLVALNQLFALSDYAGTDPAGFTLWFADQHKLDLDKMLDERDAALANVDPVVRGLQGQVQQLAGTLQQLQQRDVQAVQTSNLDTVQQFAAEKDASGALKRPYITDVTESWASHIGAIRAANPHMPNAEVLQKAYDNACWSDPAVRAKMQQPAANVQTATDRAQVAAARHAGGSVVGAPAGDSNTHVNNPNRSVREELEAQFASARAI
jgi:hypothetical protein